VSLTKQPTWKYVGRLGDVDPITYGGGFVYEDESGVYSPELQWFEPTPDEVWEELGDKTPVQTYRILLEKDSKNEWWYDKLNELAPFTGLSLEYLEGLATSATASKASLYESLIQYWGPENFDSYPQTLTESDARQKFAEELKR
jgi:hypothetical protein